MEKLVLYDSQFGNTQKLAEAIAAEINGKALKVVECKAEMLKDLELLVVGSPTQGGQPTKALRDLLLSLTADALKDMKVAAFDTGFAPQDLNFALKLLVKTIGYAAPKIAKSLQGKGGNLAAPPVTFIVKGKEGPLKDGELDRAKAWAKGLINS